MHDGVNHWLLSFNSNGHVQICDSFRDTLTKTTKKCLKSLYKSLLDKDGKLLVSLIPVQKQQDKSSCGLFAIAFAVDILNCNML